MHFKMSSAICFNLDQSKILSSCNELNLPVLRTVFLSSHWLLPHITIIEILVMVERRMNPVAMTIINLLEKRWPSRESNKRPPVLKFMGTGLVQEEIPSEIIL